MSPPQPATLPPPDNVAAGIGLKVTSVAIFLLMASLLKATGNLPPGQLVFFRSLFAIVPIIVFLAWRGELVDGFKTANPLGHLTRGLVGTGGMVLGFIALTRLPLPEAIAINYATPLLIVVFGALILKETVRLYRWSAVVVGLVGVGIILWPRLTVFSGGPLDDAGIGAVMALLACVFAAFATIAVRTLVRTERSATVVLYFSIFTTFIGALMLPFGWIDPTPEQWVMLTVAGIAGGIAQILLTESYRHADVSLVAPFEYTSLLLSLGVGYLFFAEVPTLTMLVGALIVVGAGLFIIFREHALGLERRKARQVTPPQ
ncbi:DMT family transporter [Devosia sp.]|uniref:DMT family transporter n=1 Tax=Devosia sp. TaxID=1871048 RepID=UPI0035ADB3E4